MHKNLFYMIFMTSGCYSGDIDIATSKYGVFGEKKWAHCDKQFHRVVGRSKRASTLTKIASSVNHANYRHDRSGEKDDTKHPQQSDSLVMSQGNFSKKGKATVGWGRGMAAPQPTGNWT